MDSALYYLSLFSCDRSSLRHDVPQVAQLFESFTHSNATNIYRLSGSNTTACGTAHCTATNAPQRLHPNDCTATIAPQRMHRNKWTSTNGPQRSQSNKCTATMAKQQLQSNNCKATIAKQQLHRIALQQLNQGLNDQFFVQKLE